MRASLNLAVMGALLATKSNGMGDIVTIKVERPDPGLEKRSRDADLAAIEAHKNSRPQRDRPGGNAPVAGGGAKERARRLAKMQKDQSP